MAKKIISSDVVDANVFAGITADAEKLLKVTRELSTEYKKVGKVLKDEIKNNSVSSADDVKNLQNQTKSVEAYEKGVRELAKTEVSLLKIKQEEEKVKQQEIKTNIANKKAVEQQAKATEQSAKQSQKNAAAKAKENSVYVQSVARLRELKTQLKELEITGNANSKTYKNLKEEFTSLDAKVRKAEEGVGEFQRSVGDYNASLKDAVKSSGLFGAAGNAISSVYSKLKAPFLAVGAAISGQIALFKANRAELIANAKGANIYERSIIAAKVASNGLATAARVLGIALKATGIGLLIGALGSLTVAFTKTQKGADDLSVIGKGLKVVMEELVGRVAELGFGVFNLIAGVANKVKILFKNIQVGGLEIKSSFQSIKDFLTGDKSADGTEKQIAALNKELETLTKDNSFSEGFNQISNAVKGFG
ncbi:MAG: hypothetical protein WBF67_00230, partial [Olleya sp.]